MEGNPLFIIASDHHSKDLIDKDFELNNGKESKNTYTLGFCRGVAYATALHSKSLEEMRNIVTELQNQSK